MNGKGEGKEGTFYEPVGNINFTFNSPTGGPEDFLIWTQTLKKIIPSSSNANGFPSPSTAPEITSPITAPEFTSNIEENSGGKKPSRRKTRKNRRKY